ncbi:MAG: hypothetical protein ACLFUM_05530 [Spirochaetaceae bacterium]
MQDYFEERDPKQPRQRRSPENLFTNESGGDRQREGAAEDAAVEAEFEAEPGEADFPILTSLPERYPQALQQTEDEDRDVQAVMLYTTYFDEEFLGILTERKLKLDVKFSIERDTFYNLFSSLARRRDDYLVESDRIRLGEYAKAYEADIRKRLVEMRNNLFVECDRFFSRVGRFAHDLVQDINGDGILCQNAEDELRYTEIDHETVLRGRSVKQGISLLAELCDEVVDYLDVPDFQR